MSLIPNGYPNSSIAVALILWKLSAKISSNFPQKGKNFATQYLCYLKYLTLKIICSTEKNPPFCREDFSVQFNYMKLWNFLQIANFHANWFALWASNNCTKLFHHKTSAHTKGAKQGKKSKRKKNLNKEFSKRKLKDERGAKKASEAFVELHNYCHRNLK